MPWEGMQSLGIHSRQWEPKRDRQPGQHSPLQSRHTISPKLSQHMEPSGTSRADPVLPAGQQPGSIPAAAASSPGMLQAPIARVFRTWEGWDRRRSPADANSPPTPAQPRPARHSHRLPQPEHNLGGGRGPSCGERIQQALPGLGRASKTPKSPVWHPKPS